MKQATIVSIVLGVLIVISVFQAVQLGKTTSAIKEGGLSLSTSDAKETTPLASSGVSSGKTASLPSSIKDLPQMVGGC